MQNYKCFWGFVLNHRWNSSRSSFPSPLSSNLFIIRLTWATMGNHFPSCFDTWVGVIALFIIWNSFFVMNPSLSLSRACKGWDITIDCEFACGVDRGRPMQRKKQKHETAFVAIAQFQAVKRNGGWFVEFFKQEMKIIRHCLIGNKWYNSIWFADFFFDQMAFLEFWFVFIQLLRASIVSNDDFV